MITRPTCIAELVRQAASNIGYIDASGQDDRGVCINTNKDGTNFAWQVKWSANIVRQLVNFTNTVSTITNSDLELVVLVLHEEFFISINALPSWQTPASGSNSTPTVVWTFCEASVINSVVADLISIRSAHNRLHKFILSVFCYPGLLNTMV